MFCNTSKNAGAKHWFTAAILVRDQEPPISDEKREIFYPAHFPSPSMLLRSSSTPSPAVAQSPRSPAPLSPEPALLPSSASTEHRPVVTTGVLSDRKLAQPTPPSSASTQPLSVTSSHGSAQPSRRGRRGPLPISPPPGLTTLAPVPLTEPSQHDQTPQEQQSKARAFASETSNISPNVSFTPNVATTSHKSRDGGSRNVSSHADSLDSKLEGPTSQAPRPKPARRSWSQRTGGK